MIVLCWNCSFSLTKCSSCCLLLLYVSVFVPTGSCFWCSLILGCDIKANFRNNRVIFWKDRSLVLCSKTLTCVKCGLQYLFQTLEAALHIVPLTFYFTSHPRSDCFFVFLHINLILFFYYFFIYFLLAEENQVTWDYVTMYELLPSNNVTHSVV